MKLSFITVTHENAAGDVVELDKRPIITGRSRQRKRSAKVERREAKTETRLAMLTLPKPVDEAKHRLAMLRAIPVLNAIPVYTKRRGGLATHSHDIVDTRRLRRGRS